MWLFMSDFFSLLILALALSADAFTASFVYGADRVKIPFLSTLILTLLSTGILGSFLLVGRLIRPFLSGRLPALLAALLLSLLGIQKLCSGPTKEMARRANEKDPEILTPAEALPLGTALSIDSAAAGAGMGLSESSVPLLMGLTLVLTFLAVKGGSRLGRFTADRVQFDFSKLSGFVLLLLALWKLI